MYKAGYKVKYKCPYKSEREGVIIAKFKVLDDLYKRDIDLIVYLVKNDEFNCEDFVFENNIIEILEDKIELNDEEY